MKLRLGEAAVPYPLFTLKGKLRLIGLSDEEISEILSNSMIDKIETVENLQNQIKKSLEAYQPIIRKNFEILSNYESNRGETPSLPAIVLVLEGASATGKSLIALELMHYITATRFISTDTIRQVLRGIMSEEQHPELFCHSYQAHKYRQSGSTDLDPVVRGFLAQCELLFTTIESMAKRVIVEGAISVIEGVHIIPGKLQGLGPGVIEILINPDVDTHQAMFVSKHDVGKLRTVSSDPSVRNKEFEATRAIQDFMISRAEESGVPIVSLMGYDEALQEISTLIISRVEKLLNSLGEGAGK